METLDTYLGLKEIHLVWKILCIAPWARSKKYYYTWMSFIFCFNIFFVSRTIVDYLLCEDSKCVLNHVLYYVAGWSKVSQYLLMFLCRRKLLQLENLFHMLDGNVTLLEDQVVVRKAIQTGRRILKYFLILATFYISGRMLGFILTSGEIPIVPLWSPFDGQLVIKFLYDSIVIYLLALQAIVSDMFSPACFPLLNAHFKILSQQLLRIGVGEESNIRRLIERHIIILRYFSFK